MHEPGTMYNNSPGKVVLGDALYYKHGDGLDPLGIYKLYQWLCLIIVIQISTY